jgi:hypothetical protein
MDQVTTTLLMNILTEAVGFAAENRLRLIALENVLRQQNPPLYGAYAKETETLRSQKVCELDRAALDRLHNRLLQIKLPEET